MDRIKLEICCGTTCYMLGGASLLNIERMLPEDWREMMDVSAQPCMDACAHENLGSAPFVRINGELLANATPEKVYRRVAAIVEAMGDR
ncbi:hypothetical protein SDC9_166947 [bioreactor metagenome]|uniref:Uncharacterized protein n=1 Tax=bioreactor metagenome TaxID=1076179 RepID=A0A645G0A0_9ZZZZ|nr:hypothetical protein [Victivallaceae bacterium]